MENKINLFIWRISDLLYLGWIILMSKNSLWQSHFESNLPTLTMLDNFSETLHFLYTDSSCTTFLKAICGFNLP